MSERRGSVQAGGSSSMTAKKSNKRATLSCSECRRLKLRCDRQVPCSSCVKRGLSHLCPDGALAPTRTSKLAASATALAERVELLEELLQQNGLGHTVPPMPEAANLGLDMMAKRRDQTAAAREGGNGGAVKAEGSGSGVRVMKTEEVEVEMLQMGVGSLTLRDDGSYRYLGPSAGMAFRGESTDETAGTVFAPQHPTDDPTRASPSVESLDLPSSFPFLAVQTTIEDIQDALPPKEEAVRVSKLYWDNCTFMFCPIAYNDYWDDYLENAYSAEPHAAKVACVCMVLALGVQFDPDLPPTATTVFERYFDLGQAALAVSRFLSHLAVIQALHLTGNVLLNRPKWRESGENFFPLFAVAIKGAQVMGLHRDPSAWGLDEAEVHRRRLAFWEVLSLDRLQAFMSGRPYTIHAAHFDTLMPEDVDESTKEKYRIVQFLAEAIDGLWSVKIPSYSAITAMDQQLRRQYTSSPEAARCRALPPSAFLAPGTIPPAPPAQDDAEPPSSRVQCEQHTWAMLYAVILFYMHKGPFAQALERYSEEPLQSPWAPSVRVIVLEATAYILKIARSWMSLDPVLSPRWWHISLHLFVAGVSMSSFIVRSPTSLLASHAWDQLNEACSIFESAALSGTAPAVTLPRILSLRQKAYDAITASRKLPSEPADPIKIKEDPDGAAADLLSLGTTTLLSRGGKSTAAGHAGDDAHGQASSSATAAGPPPPHQPSQGPPPYPSMAPPEAGGQSSFAGPASYLHLLTAAHNRDAPSSEQFALAPPPANPMYEPYTQHLPYPPPPHPAAANSNAFPQYGQQPPPPPPPDHSFFSPYPSAPPAAGYHLAHLLPSYPPPPGAYMRDPSARYGDFAAPLPVPPEMGHRGSTSGPSGGWEGGESAVNGAGEGREGGQGAGSSAVQDWEWWQEMAAAKPPQG